ncbi:nicotinate-nucleotide--dimethylbenzimidazole phosphoribosyltransferase [Lysinibacillus capsici]|uniref:nicotinate-nucleotide--dimethylbenzimidazole phosphoribosyltransferase n=1 Tax=Lysinibacillus capsici TaxID=2115968 RepID=UPI001C105581|nr:nicotinate-nucleotide--dimethylbenzimidazole phosphoribosyltransferase [Lysinibacillus capsici]MBU5250440.1 nicotinate-nucleotide--dimethylbenzimidazole phosphoribosyltransferase [Lysinibacillus capsici]
MQLLQDTIQNIPGVDMKSMEQARKRIDALCKPPGSLGKLESIAVQLSGITGQLYPTVDKKVMIVCAADHGVCEEGVTTNPQDVTLFQTLNFPKGGTGVCAIAGITNAKVVTVDVGVKEDIPLDAGVLIHKIKYGTDNMAQGPAMSKQEAIQSIEVGIHVATEEIIKGADVLGTGEMGIGNTTPSAAILAVLTGYDPIEVTGFGAGVGQGGIAYKAAVIEKAITLNKPNPNDVIDVLAKVGGLEIGAMTGIILGAAAHRKPVVIDGFISTIAALIAYKLEPKVIDYIIPSHASEEPGAKIAAALLGIEPMLHMNMRLGEGSGAALAFPILDAACSMMKNMVTLEESMQLLKR